MKHLNIYGMKNLMHKKIRIGRNSFFLLSCTISLIILSCSQSTTEHKEKTLTTEIDDLIERIKEGEEINLIDRNKIYDLAHYLNDKYKGDLESDEIIEVVD